MFTNLNLTDMETCYKVFRREVLQSIRIEEDRFGFEPEVTAKVAARRRGASTRSASATTAAPTPRARRSAGATACAPVWCILKYSPTGARVRALLGRGPELSSGREAP